MPLYIMIIVVIISALLIIFGLATIYIYCFLTLGCNETPEEQDTAYEINLYNEQTTEANQRQTTDV